MFRRNRRSGSKSRPNSRRRRAILRAAGWTGAILALAGFGGMRRGDPPRPGSYLVTLPGEGNSGSRIGITGDGGEDPRILTGSFQSASSPASSFDGNRFLFRGRREETDPFALWEMETGGGGIRRVTAGNGDPDHPAYLPGGRIVYSDAPAGSDPETTAIRSLYSCGPEGDDPRRLTFGEYRDGRPEVLADGRIRFLRRDPAATGGTPPAAMTIHPDGTGLALHRQSGEAPEGVRSPGRAGLTARTPPPELTSVVDPDRTTGTLLCLNAYRSDLPAIAALRPGALRKVRVSRAGDGSDGPGTWLAEAPVLPDGSFLVSVPADTPLRLDLIDAGGRTIASHRHGLWVRPNENRGCIGCHENRETAPENRFPLALQAPAAAAEEGGADAL